MLQLHTIIRNIPGSYVKDLIGLQNNLKTMSFRWNISSILDMPCNHGFTFGLINLVLINNN